MDKKNYNLEIFFESQKKSFVILSKNKITFDEVKQRTMREFRISKEFEKDMRFTIKIKNRPITILNDIQILKNFEEMSKNNYYLKIIFNINNNNYIYHSSKAPIVKFNPKMRPHTVNYFSIISNIKNNNNHESVNIDKDMENRYKDEIKKLKEEIEKLKTEKSSNNKAEIDIRKFDEKYRDLSNKNNILEQKITELENENKTLKIGVNKNTLTDNLLFENTFENDSMINQIEKIFSKLMVEHDDNIIREINGLKNTVEQIQNDQKNFYNKLRNTDDNFELLQDDKKIIIRNNDDIVDNIKIKDKNKIKKVNNLDNIDDNFDDLDNIADIIINDKEENKNNIQNIQNSNSKDKEKLNINELNTNNSKNIKRNINFYDEDEKNSKSFHSSRSKLKIIKKPEKEKKNIIKEIKNNFLEINNINENNKIISKKILNNKDSEKIYSKYTAPPKNKIDKKMKKIKNQKGVFNYSNINKDVTDEEFINIEDSSSEINSDTKKLQSDNHVNSGNSHKNIFLKNEEKKKNTLNNLNKFFFNEKMSTPTGIYAPDKKDNDKNSVKKEPNITPTGNVNSTKEKIENYFFNIFQNIFFYGINGYMNMLKISDKLLKKLKDGVMKFRLNIPDIKDYCIKYISYSIIPIVNDSSTKEYQRKIIKSKITTVLEALRIDKKYFDKEYKEYSDEKNADDRSFNGINVTHSKINEFRKMYELKEKDYSDEQIIKALIRYRGNRELAFQYLFY